MKNLRISFPWLAGVIVAILVLAGMVWMSSPAEAGPPGPECGPTYLWVCTGGGQEILFAGTICEKEHFESQTDLTCVPYGG